MTFILVVNSLTEGSSFKGKVGVGGSDGRQGGRAPLQARLCQLLGHSVQEKQKVASPKPDSLTP